LEELTGVPASVDITVSHGRHQLDVGCPALLAWGRRPVLARAVVMVGARRLMLLSTQTERCCWPQRGGREDKGEGHGAPLPPPPSLREATVLESG
jgi:hypothetical protein